MHMHMAEPALAASPISFDVYVPVSTVSASLKSECFLFLFMHMRMAKLALAASPISFKVCVPVSTVLASLKSECFLCLFYAHAHGRTCTRSVAHFI